MIRLQGPLRTWLGRAIVTATVALIIGGNAFTGVTPARLVPPRILHDATGWWIRLSPLYALAFAFVGALIIARRPGNRVGWVCAGIGLLTGVNQFGNGFALYGTYRNPHLSGLAFMNWLQSWDWAVPVLLMLFFLPLLFPDGKPISPWLWLLAPLEIAGFALPIAGVTWGIRFSEFVGPTASIIATGSLIVRFRRADQDERQQIRWFAVAGVLLVLVGISGIVLGNLIYHDNRVVFNPVFDVLIPLAFTALAASVGIAVLRYRLYDIDLLIRQALVYGSLVVLISVVYFVTVVSIGSRLGAPRNDPAGAVAVGAIVALLFQPVRRRLQRLANRLVYGQRATPYEVLSRFSRQVGDMVASQELPVRMAHVLAEGTAAERATVWLRVGDQLREAATWPVSSAKSHAVLGLVDGQLPSLDGATEAAPVRYQGEMLGALTVEKRQPMTPTERRLLDDLAQESGLVLKNARLTAELVERLDDLQASRERLLTAQDTARRQLERNLHDGAQQNLVALKLKIALARNLAATDPKRAQAALDELTGEANEAIETLRELARGLYPPILAQDGLAAAIEGQARRMPVPVEVQAANLPRYPQETEASVYFCVLEALQNIGKHSGASKATVSLKLADGRLTFSVRDNGVGLDPAVARRGSGMQNMRDRLEVLGGRFQVQSEPNAGTTVTGSIPVPT